MDWLQLAQDRDEWWAIENAVNEPLGSVKFREYLDQLSGY
jgi:hypothetical protein